MLIISYKKNPTSNIYSLFLSSFSVLMLLLKTDLLVVKRSLSSVYSVLHCSQQNNWLRDSVIKFWIYRENLLSEWRNQTLGFNGAWKSLHVWKPFGVKNFSNIFTGMEQVWKDIWTLNHENNFINDLIVLW